MIRLMFCRIRGRVIGSFLVGCKKTKKDIMRFLSYGGVRGRKPEFNQGSYNIRLAGDNPSVASAEFSFV